MKIKKGPLAFILIIIIGTTAYFGKNWWDSRPQAVKESVVVTNAETAIPDGPDASLVGASIKLPLPSKSIVGGGISLTKYEMGWNSQTGEHLANGGVRTTKGSLVERTGLDVKFIRQDDPLNSITELIKNTILYADAIKGGKDPKNDPLIGGVGVTVMSSGALRYLKIASDKIKEAGLPDDYQPVIVFTTGASKGEDQVIGDIKFRKNPELLRGQICAGVKLDGDLDIIFKFVGDNGKTSKGPIPINVNPETYDPNALNLEYSETYLTAVNTYNSYAKVTRKLVLNGVNTGRDTIVQINLVSTWTPGDVAASNNRGGGTIISTKDYSAMMCNVTIMSKKFANDAKDELIDYVAAVAQAGDQIRSFTDTKKYACQLTAEIFNEENGDYWYRYFNGETKGDFQLGGSMVYNLNDMNLMFGLEGNPDIYKSVYNTFGKIQSKLYPEEFVGGYLPYDQIMFIDILTGVNRKYPELRKGKAITVDYTQEMSEIIANKAVHINFAIGSDVISESSYDELDELGDNLLTNTGLKIKLEGHTDNTGNPIKNMELSRQRALSVRRYLIDNKDINVDRFEPIGAFGSSKPIDNNNTVTGRANNRRVEVIQGK